MISSSWFFFRVIRSSERSHSRLHQRLNLPGTSILSALINICVPRMRKLLCRLMGGETLPKRGQTGHRFKRTLQARNEMPVGAKESTVPVSAGHCEEKRRGGDWSAGTLGPNPTVFVKSPNSGEGGQSPCFLKHSTTNTHFCVCMKRSDLIPLTSD